ncbi:MAG: 4-(cytidine 5'-diphospho)-2-C-methyl-D-erythritol kinase [Planctomycetes bacterium]|nr:4-(cytidine 5'-diphospho)-2-C-methyl-D-erythritol kinase [Planctomycetota bacterium]
MGDGWQTRQAPAKVNCFLEVVGKRADGFHDIESVFVEIDLADTLSAAPGEDGGIHLSCDDPAVPPGGDNLVLRAADLLRRECGRRDGIRFRLEKRIPMGGGLGGGSSDAAAALRLANAVWNAGLSDSDLAALAARVGSDVPFFLQGGVCLCEGRGERITPLGGFPGQAAFGLALGGIHSDTAAAYRRLRLPEPGGRRSAGPFLAAMARGDVTAMAAAAFNRFEPTVYAALPALARFRDRAAAAISRPIRLSGSGSGLWWLEETAGGAARPPTRVGRVIRIVTEADIQPADSVSEG